jgi:hypothetical protein
VERDVPIALEFLIQPDEDVALHLGTAGRDACALLDE